MAQILNISANSRLLKLPFLLKWQERRRKKKNEIENLRQLSSVKLIHFIFTRFQRLRRCNILDALHPPAHELREVKIKINYQIGRDKSRSKWKLPKPRFNFSVLPLICSKATKTSNFSQLPHYQNNSTQNGRRLLMKKGNVRDIRFPKYLISPPMANYFNSWKEWKLTRDPTSLVPKIWIQKTKNE